MIDEERDFYKRASKFLKDPSIGKRESLIKEASRLFGHESDMTWYMRQATAMAIFEICQNQNQREQTTMTEGARNFWKKVSEDLLESPSTGEQSLIHDDMGTEST